MRAHGWTRDLPADTPALRAPVADHFEAYRFILPGYNVRPLEMEAAVGLEQLKKLPAMTAARRRNLALFQELFDGDDRFIIQRENGTQLELLLHHHPQPGARARSATASLPR